METLRLQEQPSPTSAKSPTRDEVTAITALRGELDDFYAQMKVFPQMDQSEIFMNLAAMSSRASELRGRINRSGSRRLDTFRTKELDPFLEEVDRQFKVWSRVVTIRGQEWEMSGRAI